MEEETRRTFKLLINRAIDLYGSLGRFYEEASDPNGLSKNDVRKFFEGETVTMCSDDIEKLLDALHINWRQWFREELGKE